MLVDDDSKSSAVYRGSMALLAASDADRVLLSIEDAWGETRAQNLPGTDESKHPNWLSRGAHAMEDFDSVEDLIEALKTVQRYRERPELISKEADR